MNNHIFVEKRIDVGSHDSYDVWDFYFRGRREMSNLTWQEVKLLQELLTISEIQFTEQTQ